MKYVFLAKIQTGNCRAEVTALFTTRSRANTWVKDFAKRVRTESVCPHLSLVIDIDTEEEIGSVTRMFIMC